MLYCCPQNWILGWLLYWVKNYRCTSPLSLLGCFYLLVQMLRSLFRLSLSFWIDEHIHSEEKVKKEILKKPYMFGSYTICQVVQQTSRTITLTSALLLGMSCINKKTKQKKLLICISLSFFTTASVVWFQNNRITKWHCEAKNTTSILAMLLKL